jgi:imidazolonepropionase-like amidohydrolase
MLPFATLLLLVPGPLSVPQEPAMVLRNARVIDVVAGRAGEPMALVLQAGRITAIQAVAAATPAGAEVVEIEGAFVLPGLIDLHTHLVLHAYDEASWNVRLFPERHEVLGSVPAPAGTSNTVLRNDQVLKESLELRTIRGVNHARATLAAGFTTVRDLGTEGAGFADVALRDAIAQALIPGPRVLATTQQSAGHAVGCRPRNSCGSRTNGGRSRA